MSGATILLADDDRAIRTVIGRALALKGHNVRSAADAATLWGWVEAGEGDLVITDVVMPDANGLDLVPRIRARRPDMPVIVVSAQSTLQTAVRASERAVFEYLPKPFDLAELTAAVERALSLPAVAVAAAPEPAAAEDVPGLPLIGRSPAMQEVYRAVARLMSTDLTVLITGESGTGKELVARALHEYGRRSAGPFVAINVAAIPRELVEAELFGHERGAFTGATARGTGRFEQAQGGTLFLDEIGDMPTEAQTRLLRVLQEGEFNTIGGRTPIRADVRIIAATHRDLRRLVAQGRFREDLYYRVNVVPIRLPALRDRPEDIPELVEHFLRRAAADGLPAKRLDHEALAALAEYGWPGNVRELENLVRRIVALQPLEVIPREVVVREVEAESSAVVGEPVEDDNLGAAVSGHLGRYFAAHAPGLPPPGLHLRVLREIERPLITLALAATKGNQIKAAALLGLNRNTLRKKIRDLDIEVVRGIR